MKLALLSVGVLAGVATASIAAAQGYQPIVSVPFLDANTQSVEGYLNAAYWLFIVIGAFLAVFKIISGGVKWMFSEGITSKSEARKDITGAIFGLLIILAAVLVLNTINPNLTCFKLFSEAGSSCDATNESGGALERAPILTPIPFGTVILNSSRVPLNFDANCGAGRGKVYYTNADRTSDTSRVGCFADHTLIDANIDDVFDPSIYHPTIGSLGYFIRSCESKDLIFVSSDNSCRGSLVTGEIVVGSRLSIVGAPVELVNEAWSTYTSALGCPGGTASRTSTEIVCYANPLSINAVAGNIFDPAIYRAVDQSDARERFESTCEENGHTFVESDVSCQENVPSIANCSAAGLIYVSSQDACGASLVQSAIVVGSEVRIQGAPLELITDVAVRYHNECPGKAETSEDGVFIRCYTPINSINANAGDVLNLQTYSPTQRTAAAIAFQTSCEEKDLVYTAAERRCDFPGIDYIYTEALPVNNFCRPFDGNYRCSPDFISICTGATYCLLIRSDAQNDNTTVIEHYLQDAIGNWSNQTVFGIGRCGGNTCGSVGVGGAQAGHFDRDNTIVLVENRNLLTGINALVSVPGAQDFQTMQRAVYSNFRNYCASLSGEFHEYSGVSHPTYPGLVGKYACTPPSTP